jgi:hypothetical protein
MQSVPITTKVVSLNLTQEQKGTLSQGLNEGDILVMI